LAAQISEPDFNRKLREKTGNRNIVCIYILFSHHLLAELTNKRKPCIKFATLRLSIETMPIYKAVATGKGNNEFYRERTRSDLK
jgi:hypothetical protein